MVLQTMQKPVRPKRFEARAKFLTIVVLLGFILTTLNEFRDPTLVVSNLLQRPTVLTVVGHGECVDFHVAENLVNSVTPSTNGKLIPRIVEVESTSSYESWIKTRQAAQQVVPDFSSCPIVFTTVDSQNPMLLGSVRDLIVYLEMRYPNALDYTVYLSKLDVPSTDVPTISTPVEVPTPQEVQTGISIPAIVAQIPPIDKMVVATYRKSGPMKNFKPLKEYFQDHKGFKFVPQSPSGAGVVLVQDRTSAKSARQKSPNALINHLGFGGQGCIGGSKGAQLRCRIEKAAADGCKYDTLGVQPMQYRLYIPEECRDFVDTACSAPESESKLWIEKPSGGEHGVGMRVHRGCGNLKKRFSSCGPNMMKVIAMEYVDTALIDGHKFDMRTYSLVASTKPFLFFYHDGFARRATSAYDSGTSNLNAHITNAVTQKESDDHFWDFDRLGRYLHDAHGFPKDFLKNEFRREAMRIQNFALQATWHDFKPGSGNFQVYAHDWILDRHGGLHMLEANGRPWVRNYPIPGFPEVWNNMMELIVKVHTEPETLGPLATGMTGPRGKTVGSGPKNRPFEYKDWILFFNSAEEEAVGAKYNSCEEFAGERPKIDISPVESREDVRTNIADEASPTHNMEQTTQSEEKTAAQVIQENNDIGSLEIPIVEEPTGDAVIPDSGSTNINTLSETETDQQQSLGSAGNVDANNDLNNENGTTEQNAASKRLEKQAKQDAEELAQDELMKQNPELLRNLENDAREQFFDYVQRRGDVTLDIQAISQRYSCLPGTNSAGAVQLDCAFARGTKDISHFYILFPESVTSVPESYTVSAQGTGEPQALTLVTGGMHGNEAAGYQAAGALRKQLRPGSGVVVVIPCLNARACRQGTRYIPASTKEVQDLNRDFPVDLAAPPKGHLAGSIWDLVSMLQPHLLIDLHEGWGFYAETKQNYVPGMQLVANKKFSKGSSVIASSDAIQLARRMLAEVNFVRHTPRRRFFLHTPPVNGGLAMRLASAFQTRAVLLETTSKTQAVALRKEQQLIMVIAALRTLHVVPEQFTVSDVGQSSKSDDLEFVAPTLAPLKTSSEFAAPTLAPPGSSSEFVAPTLAPPGTSTDTETAFAKTANEIPGAPVSSEFVAPTLAPPGTSTDTETAFVKTANEIPGALVGA